MRLEHVICVSSKNTWVHWSNGQQANEIMWRDVMQWAHCPQVHVYVETRRAFSPMNQLLPRHKHGVSTNKLDFKILIRSEGLFWSLLNALFELLCRTDAQGMCTYASLCLSA